MLVHNFLEKQAIIDPQKNAAWCSGDWWTYSKLNTVSIAIANYLKKAGIKRGERVALLLHNSLEYIASYFGVLKAGAVVVSLGTDLRDDGLEYCLNHSDASAIIADIGLSRFLVPALKKAPLIKMVILAGDTSAVPSGFEEKNVGYFSDISERTGSREIQEENIDLDLAEIVYTSGSTGTPKGVMLSHLNLVANMHSIAQYLHLTPEDRQIVILPFNYIYGKSLLLTHILVGGSVVIDNRFMYPNTVLKTMIDMKVTGFAGVPSTYAILLNRSSIRDMHFPALRYITQAGGAMAPSLQADVADVFAPAALYVMYGATEAAPRLSYLDPELLESKLGSIGKAVPNVELEIHDEDGNTLPPGETGEIVARGSNIMRGYWKDPSGTEKVLKNGFYYSGDLGKVDADGLFYVVGRSRDIIKVKGFRVSAKEIEECLLDHESILEAAVIGVDDQLLGEAISAFIVPKSGHCITIEELESHLARRLPAYKMPKFYQLCSSLPKNQSGKVMKNELRK
ncbi:MAG: AMP-binding protein [Spirochaetales bacterium]|jgi:long-chain acyl-CoA synthetase|nr:AMP-binding protein [Spirochaetales bacterium]